MTTPQQEMVTTILRRAQALLESQGEFYPLGFISWAHEAPQEVRVPTPTEPVGVDEYLALLERAMRQLVVAASKPPGICAIARSVVHTDTTTGVARDAVEVRVEGPLCDEPFRIFAGRFPEPGGAVAIRDLVATTWEPRIFR